LSGQASADGDADGAVRFAADLRGATAKRAQAKSTATLRLEQLTLQGRWQGEQIELTRLQLNALQAQVTGQQLRIHTAPALQGRLQALRPAPRRSSTASLRRTAARAGSACAWPTRSVPSAGCRPCLAWAP
jgi:hypothetical protein